MTFITDKDTAYAKFAAGRDNFTHIVLKRGGATYVLGKYHVQNVNNYHRYLKKFIGKLNGVSTKYLNNYLVWHNQVRGIGKINIILLKRCLKAKKVTRWHNVGNRLAIPSLG